MDKKETILVANGTTSKILKAVNLNINIENLQSIKYEIVFKVIELDKHMIILGMEFLTENKGTINLKDRILTLDRQEFELDGVISKWNEFDMTVPEKNQIFNISKTEIETEIKEMIEN